jgi:predicted lipoprotein with Yx(FWY)xxD motif
MRNALMLASAAATLGLFAGCGSSKKSNSTSTSTASSTPAATTGSSTSAAGSSGSGGYGAGASGGAAGSGANAATVTTKHGGDLGTILAAGPKKLTVYLFESDTPTRSSCSGACASVWPPVTTSGSAVASGTAMTADLGTITRPDGTKQVTYKGHPLYYYTRDKDSGDSYGEGLKLFGAEWYVLAPSGKKVDKS